MGHPKVIHFDQVELFSVSYYLLVAMDGFDVTDGWIGFLVGYFVDICQSKNIEECLGCQDNKSAPLLHRHIQWGLQDQLGYYFRVGQTSVLDNINDLYHRYASLLECKGIKQQDAKALIEEGVNFFSKTSPSEIYYGRYKKNFNETCLEPIYREALTLQTNPCDTPLIKPKAIKPPKKQVKRPRRVKSKLQECPELLLERMLAEAVLKLEHQG